METDKVAGAGQHLLLIRNIEWDQSLSAAEVQSILDEFMGWAKALQDAGILAGAQPLDRSGKIVTGKGGAVVSDGPFAEAKEAVGGYFLLNVPEMNKALEWARKCPGLDHGLIIEVRPVAEECAIQQQLNAAQLAEASNG